MVLLTDDFFARFPGVRFFLAGRKYKYVDGALEEVAAPKRRAAPASAPAPKRRR